MRVQTTNIIYVDTSVVLAAVRSEKNMPSADFWTQPLLVSSVLCEYETWARLHANGEAARLESDAAAALGALNLIGLTPEIGARCRAPFPAPVRTLDALHLATADHLRAKGYPVCVATFDQRMRDIAITMGFAVYF